MVQGPCAHLQLHEGLNVISSGSVVYINSLGTSQVSIILPLGGPGRFQEFSVFRTPMFGGL
jgi:hypothetical protein